jgi:hypothetical protein
MKRKILGFLVRYKFTNVDYVNLNLLNLCKKFNVKFIDLSKITLKNKIYNFQSKFKKKNFSYINIKNIYDLKKSLSNVDYIFDYGELLIEDKIINNFISKKIFKEKKVLGIISGSLPNFFNHNSTQKIYFLFLYLYNAFKYKKFFLIIISTAKFVKIYFNLLKKNYKNYKFSYDYILVDSDINEKKANLYFLNSRKIYVHYKDYEKHLLRSSKKKYNGNYAVFLDESIFDHPDDYETWSGYNFKLRKYANNYYNTLNNFFNNFEVSTGTKVIIAAHPKSLYSNYDCKKYFMDRKVIKNNTYELVRGAKLVFAHTSSSTAYAILLKKPLIFLNNSLMFDIGLFSRILSFSIETGCKFIDINENINYKDLLKKNSTLYKKYIYKFLKSSKSKNNKLWNIFFSQVNKI